MRKLFGLVAALGLALTTGTSASATPMLGVSATHLGGGLIQYTIDFVNNLGGAVAAQLTMSRAIPNAVCETCFIG